MMEQTKVDFDCRVENVADASGYKGLEFVSSEAINGVPSNPDLLNPTKVDELIEEGKVRNYTSEIFREEEMTMINTI